MDTSSRATADVTAGERQLLQIIDLFAAIHWRGDPPPDQVAAIGQTAIHGKHRPMDHDQGAETTGVLGWRPRECYLTLPTSAGRAVLFARLKVHREYAVCGIDCMVAGPGTPMIVREVAAILRPALAQSSEQDEALRNALRRMAGHWERVLLRQLEATR